MIKKLLFWLIKAKTVNCMHCCLWCEYWEQCQEEYNMLKLGLQKKTMINEKNQRRSEDE